MRNFIFLLFILIGVSAYAKTNIEETKKAIVAKYDAIEIKDEEEARIDEIRDIIHIHPTLSEILQIPLL